MSIRVRCRALVVVGCAAASLAHAQAGVVVEARGEAIYRIPIVVPPGPADHQPDLALVYASGEGRGPAGWLGFGWSLAGESRIERETRSASPYDFDNRNCGAGGKFPCYRRAYVLDGQDLICSSGACASCTTGAPCRYRTQSDDGRMISFKGDASGWEILDRDGRILVYGATGAGRLVNPTSMIGQVYSWQLESSTDVSGNVIRYTWDTTSSTNVAYLRRIEYGQGTTSNRSVEFVLNDPAAAPRADRPVSARAGFRQQTDRRVTSIEVRAASSELVTRYSLTYTQDRDSLRSRLATVQRFGADSTTTLPPYSFFYSERATGDGFKQTNEPGFFGAESQCPPLGGLRGDPNGVTLWNIADLNRDGIGDLYQVYDSDLPTGRTEVSLGTGARMRPGAGLTCGYQLARGTTWSLDRLFFGSVASTPTLQVSGAATLDLDGDGFLDHIDRLGSFVSGSDARVPMGIRLGSATGFSPTTLPTSMELPHSWDFRFSGAFYNREFWIRVASTQSGIFSTSRLLGDVTGDGRPDLIVARGALPFEYWDGAAYSSSWASWSGWAVFVNRGLKSGTNGTVYLDFGSEPVLWIAPAGSSIETISYGISSVALADQNGDGLPDRLTADGVAYGYGAGFYPPESLTSTLEYDLIVAPGFVQAGLYDLNSDGFLDHVAAQSGASDPYWHVHFGTGNGFNPAESLFRRVVDASDLPVLEADGLQVSSRSIRDVNGDGRLDYIASGPDGVFLQEGMSNHDGAKTEPLAGLLTRAVDPLGGTIEFYYATSPQFQTSSGLPANPGSPLQIPVVTRVVYGDGRAGTPRVETAYGYASGVFDGVEKEFRGFGTVIATEVENGVGATRTTSTYLTDRVCSFSPASIEISSGASVLERSSMSYVRVVGGGAADADQWGRCLPSTRVDEAVEGSEQARRARRTSWNYGSPIDASYNLAKLEEWGEWSLATNQDVPGDERITELTYATASDDRPSIVSRVDLELVKDSAGNVYSKTKYCYLEPACTSAGNGLIVGVTRFLTDYSATPLVVDVPIRLASIVYDAYGNPTRSTGPSTRDDPGGLQTTIAYDATYQTFPVSVSRGSDVSLPLRALVTTLAYAGCAGGYTPPSALGLPCRVEATRGHADTFGYDALGRVSRIERPGKGYVETHSYSIPGQVSPGENTIESRLIRAGVADLVERQHLDGLSRIYRHESPGKESETVIVERTFDERGRLRTESLPYATGTPLLQTYAYDALGRTRSVLDPDSITQRVQSHLPWTEIEETYFGVATPANRKARAERATDGLGRLVRVANYEDAANPTKPFVVTAKYDAADRLYEIRDPMANDASLCTGACPTQDHVTEIRWDTLGREVRVDDPDSGVWTYRYNAAGLLEERTQNSGTSASRIQRIVYDRLERPIARSFLPTGNGVADARFVYGNDDTSPDYGQLIEVTSGDPTGTTYLYGHDEAGRRVSVIQRTAGVEFSSAWEFDELDRVKRHLFPDGDAFDYHYDGIRLVDVRADASNPGFTGPVLRYADYDALGRMKRLEIGQGTSGAPLATQSYTYDDKTARLARITGAPGGGVSGDPDGDRISSAGDRCPNAYDPSQLDGGGVGEESAPDGIGDACQCGDVDGDGRVTIMDVYAILTAGFGAEPLAKPELCDVDGSGSCDQNDFFPLMSALSIGSGDLQRCAASKPANVPSSAPLDLAVAFDGLGRLTSQAGQLGSESVNRFYTYDGLSRLKTAVGSWEKARGYAGPVTWTYSYDALGNLRGQQSSRSSSRHGDSRSWRYSHPTKPHFLSAFIQDGAYWETISATGGGEAEAVELDPVRWRETFTWNALGKLHRYEGSTYHYDAFDDVRLTITGHGDESTSIVTVGDDFEYDVGAQRANKSFSIDGVRIATLATRYAPQSASATTLAIGPGRYGRHAEPILALLTDHLGTVRAVVNQDGVVVETRDFSPFGESVAHAGAFSLEHRFTGQAQDDQAGGLYDYGARFYDPRWGRFISPDEAVQGFDSQGQNPFSYVLNRPTSATDPTGNLIWNGVSFGAWSTPTLQSGVLQTAPSSARPSAIGGGFRLLAMLNPGILGFAATGTPRPPPSVLGMIAKVILVDFQALSDGVFSEFVINPFQSVGGLIDSLLNGDFHRARLAVEQLVEGTLVPRYGLQNGVFWGRGQTSNDKLDSVLDEAGFEHDGLCTKGCSNEADRTWVRIAWSSPWRLGPYGQAYRLVGTAAFGARIAWRTLTGQAE